MTASDAFLWVENGAGVALERLPARPFGDAAGALVELCREGARVTSICPLNDKQLVLAIADDAHHRIGLVLATLAHKSYRSLTPWCPQLHLFERELLEDLGIRPEGHPWLKPVRKHADLDSSGAAHPFFRVDGPSIHEVGVGPVHAGTIESGHFRFQCHGETVLHLEIQLGYQHRGAERLLLRSSPARRVIVAESICGDTAVGHALAHAMCIEALADVDPAPRAHALRAIALELERLHNHVGDLAFLCNDVGYLPGASWLGRLRGEFLNLLMTISGNRFGRGLVVPGGTRRDLDANDPIALVDRIDAATRDLEDTMRIVLDSPALASRFERTGVVSKADATAIGAVGVTARASGRALDVRRDHPFGAYAAAPIEPSVETGGDVMARLLVRWAEVQRSIAWVRARLGALPDGRAVRAGAPLVPRAAHVAVALVEAWRGEIAHVVVTDDAGAVRAIKIKDPSFHNWTAVCLALRGNQISDFPLCNKSFNLSYAGFDL